ncbi:hypothetical protein BY996DRAFT_4584732, partial [Phakopsora pachyrhizi]
FLLRLISSHIQWFNKPKFHIKLHLSLSIAHIGTASRFTNEKFESYNGVVIQESIN